MYKRKPNNLLRFIVIGLVVLIVGIVVTYPLWIPYFVDEVVNEEFPILNTTNDTQTDTDAEQEVIDTLTDSDTTVVESDTSSTETDTQSETQVESAEMVEEPIGLVQGSFSFIDAVHNGQGTATVYELSDGSRVLRFEDFQVTNGPDLHVILSPETPDGLTDGVGEYLDLGSLKGNVGNQNYDIPADVNLADYASVVIYCEPFRVVFSSATLSPLPQ